MLEPEQFLRHMSNGLDELVAAVGFQIAIWWGILWLWRFVAEQ